MWPAVPVRRLGAAAVGADVRRRVDQVIRQDRAAVARGAVLRGTPPCRARARSRSVVTYGRCRPASLRQRRRRRRRHERAHVDDVRLAPARSRGRPARTAPDRSASACRPVRSPGAATMHSRGAHADVEVDAQRGRLAAGVVLAALPGAMRRRHRPRPFSVTAKYGRFAEVEELRDDAGVVDPVASRSPSCRRCPAPRCGRPGSADRAATGARRRACRSAMYWLPVVALICAHVGWFGIGRRVLRVEARVTAGARHADEDLRCRSRGRMELAHADDAGQAPLMSSGEQVAVVGALVEAAGRRVALHAVGIVDHAVAVEARVAVRRQDRVEAERQVERRAGQDLREEVLSAEGRFEPVSWPACSSAVSAAAVVDEVPSSVLACPAHPDATAIAITTMQLLLSIRSLLCGARNAKGPSSSSRWVDVGVNM